MAEQTQRQSAHEVLDRYIAQHKMRRTPERFAILDKALEMTQRFTADELRSAMSADDYIVSPATVYSTLRLLTEAGLVRRHDHGSTATYERVAGRPGRFHLVCRLCGKVREFKDAGIDEAIAVRRYGTFHPDYADLYVYGVCGVCSRKNRRLSASPDKKSTK